YLRRLGTVESYVFGDGFTRSERRFETVAVIIHINAKFEVDRIAFLVCYGGPDAFIRGAIVRRARQCAASGATASGLRDLRDGDYRGGGRQRAEVGEHGNSLLGVECNLVEAINPPVQTKRAV